eukprot:evm.model.scf_2760.1 EVM.evm.TU.scf_2760.1   scf_2760:1068-7777(+)
MSAGGLYAVDSEDDDFQSPSRIGHRRSDRKGAGLDGIPTAGPPGASAGRVGWPSGKRRPGDRDWRQGSGVGDLREAGSGVVENSIGRGGRTGPKRMRMGGRMEQEAIDLCAWQGGGALSASDRGNCTGRDRKDREGQRGVCDPLGAEARMRPAEQKENDWGLEGTLPSPKGEQEVGDRVGGNELEGGCTGGGGFEGGDCVDEGGFEGGHCMDSGGFEVLDCDEGKAGAASVRREGSCPVCGCELALVAETELGRLAHVNGCLDKGSEVDCRKGKKEVVDGCLGVTGDGNCCLASGSDGGGCHAGVQKGSGNVCREEWLETDSDGSSIDIEEWLLPLGLAKYAPLFKAAEVDRVVLPYLTENDLVEMGIQCPEDRQAILVEAHTLTQVVPVGLMNNARHTEWNALVGPHQDPVEDAHEGRCRQNHLIGPTGSSHLVQRTLHQVLGVHSRGRLSHRRGGHTAHPSAIRRKQPDGGQWLPEWQRVPGTQFVVDRFNKVWGVRCKSWFLTHFHSDHYHGLNASFDKGTIYCTPTTARLAHAQLRVPWPRLVEVELKHPRVIEGVRVTFFDANHCPGAAMVLFEPPDAPPVLHTGDARLTPAIRDEPSIQALCGRGAVLVLDTTYCDPRYAFPVQEDVVRFVAEAASREAANPSTLCLFGTYTIGKERIFFGAARALGRRVFVEGRKAAVLACVDMPREERAMLTTRREETNLHVVGAAVSILLFAKCCSAFQGTGNCGMPLVCGHNPAAHGRGVRAPAYGSI